jgi:hypothetical protein
LADAEQDEVLALVSSWTKMAGLNEWSPKLIKTAITFLHPPEGARDPDDSARSKLARQFAGLVKETSAQLPEKTDKAIVEKLDGLAEKALALGRPPRTTGIDWTEATWNPLQGCTRASAGCDYCYAAKLMATRRAGVYPGLAKEVRLKEKKTYAFCGKIVMLPDHLAVPLEDRTPKRYFVNSMSDLFHRDVPDQFIGAVFTVMEKASWHQFQVLTKRPERMCKAHLSNILTFFVHHLTNGPIEGLNNKIQGLIKKAFGYPNKERFKSDIFFHLGGLDLYPAQ